MGWPRSWDRMPGMMLRAPAVLGRLPGGLISPVSSPMGCRCRRVRRMLGCCWAWVLMGSLSRMGCRRS